MSLVRFETMSSCLVFSLAPATDGEARDTTSEEWRCGLVNHFEQAIHACRAEHVTPGDTTYVDESFSRRYGQEENWISRALAAKIVIDRKPENGCEI